MKIPEGCISILCVSCFCLGTSIARAELSCSWSDSQHDPSLKEMRYDVGNGEERVDVYVEPGVDVMYSGNPPASTIAVPKFEGFSTKFINMGNKRVKLYW